MLSKLSCIKYIRVYCEKRIPSGIDIHIDRALIFKYPSIHWASKPEWLRE